MRGAHVYLWEGFHFSRWPSSSTVSRDARGSTCRRETPRHCGNRMLDCMATTTPLDQT